MLLLIIAILALAWVIWWASYDMGIGGFFFGVFFGGLIIGLLFLLIQTGIYEVTANVHQEKHTEKIVSLADGKGVEGQIGGGIFIMSGYIQDTQHFAYYREKAPNAYTLEKRDAGASTIHTDATPETARVEITDNIKTCEPSIWQICWGTPPTASFAHADFHVPANSIKQQFELDAQ